MPTLQLPQPSTEPLANSPLELVVCQVRHENNLAVSAPKTYLEVKGQLGESYPLVDQISSPTVNISASESGEISSKTNAEVGWRLRSADSYYAVTLTPKAFSLETRAYSSWDEFYKRLCTLVEAVNNVYHPDMEERLGLRFIDRIVVAEVDSLSKWQGWIKDSLLGPVVDTSLGSAIHNVQQVIEFDAEDDLQVILRHGSMRPAISPKQPWQYLLDYDCFRSKGLQFSVDSVCVGAEQLHTLSLAVFQASITSKLYNLLRG